MTLPLSDRLRPSSIAGVRAWLRHIVWVVAILAAEPAAAQSRVLFEFQSGTDFQGPVHYATVDGTGVPWIAAPRQLYRIEHGRPLLVESTQGSGNKLVLAPGARRLARLSSGKSPFGRFTADLVDPARPGVTIATLSSPSVPSAFSGIYVGRGGNLIVTVTARDNAEARSGAFNYVLWSDSGQVLGSVTLAGPRMGVFDENGQSILLFGEAEATAVRKDGAVLWSLADAYRLGVLGDDGDVAILSPSKEINEVHVVRRGSVAVSKMPAPVHALAVTPDGAFAAVATDKGRLYLIELQSCDADSCPFTEGPLLPVPAPHQVSDLRFLDRSTLVVAVFEVTDAPTGDRYDRGAVIVITTNGRLKFRRSITLPQPPTWSPLLNVAFGNRTFVAYTRDTAVVIRIGN